LLDDVNSERVYPIERETIATTQEDEDDDRTMTRTVATTRRRSPYVARSEDDRTMTRTIDDTDEKSPSGISPFEANNVMIDQLADHILKKSLCGKKVNAKTTPDEEVPKWHEVLTRQPSPIVANENKKKNNEQQQRLFYRSAWASTYVAPPPSLQECMIFALATVIKKEKMTNNNNTGVHFDWTTLRAS